MLSKTPLFPKRNGSEQPPPREPVVVDLNDEFKNMAHEKFIKPTPPRTVDGVRDELVATIERRDQMLADFNDHITALKTELKALITEETTRFQGALAALGEADTWLDALPATKATEVPA